MLVQLIVDTIVSGGAVVGFYSARAAYLKRKNKTAIDGMNVMKWAWVGKYNGYQCPKCTSAACNGKQPPICGCEEYHKHHYHFKCNDCGFESVMKTADDK
jgi:hypothetical protein